MVSKTVLGLALVKVIGVFGEGQRSLSYIPLRMCKSSFATGEG